MSARRPVVVPALLLLLVLGLAGFRFGGTTADPDLWGHVLNGIDTIEAERYVGVDTYSYLSGDQPWINHHWLGDVVMGSVYLSLGSAGLVFVKAIIALGVVAIVLWWLIHLGMQPVRAAMVGLLLVAVLTPTFGTFRPQLFTVLSAVLLFLVMVGVEAGRTKLLWLLPPTYLLWANLHGGVLAGLAILGVWSVVHAWRSDSSSRFWPLAAFGASLLATLINPNGWRLLQFLMETATVSRPEIQDWQPIELGSAVGIVYLVLVGITVVALIFDRKRLNPALVIPLIALLVGPLVAWRHLQLFAVGVAILGGTHLTHLSERLGSGEPNMQRPTGRGLAMVLVVSVALGGLGLAQFSSCIRVDAIQFEFPQRAAATWASVQPEGNAVVPFNWGEFMRWHFGPEVQISIDGRRETVYSESVYQANLDFLEGRSNWDALLQLAPTEWVFIPTASPVVELAGSTAGWHEVYRDPVATILSRSEIELRGDERLPIDGHGSCFPMSF